MRMCIAAAATTLLTACSMSADTKAAEDAVISFHDQLDARQFQAMYDGASDDLKQATTRERFVALLEAVHRKLGNTQSSAEKGWNINSGTSGTFVTLTYASTYAEGEASEQFVYRLHGNTALLAGYNINSDVLITK
jgi:hypothetical protein